MKDTVQKYVSMLMEKSSTVLKGKTSQKEQKEETVEKQELYDPFLAAKKEWNERYGDYISRAKNYRYLAAISSVTALFAVIGMFWIASQKTYVPYIVEVDQHGKAARAGFAQKVGVMDEKLIKAYLVSFLNNWRMVTTDSRVQNKSIHALYSMLPANSPAVEKINGFYKSNSPLKVAKMHTVSVQVKTLLPLSKNTWQVEWVEIIRNPDGKEKNTLRWKAFFNIAFQQVNDERLMLTNPLGLFITDINWSQEL